MSVDYERWLIPRGSVFLPSAAAVAKVVERLRKERWIPDPASPDFARLRFKGASAKLAAKTGGYAVRSVENTFGDDVVAKLAASTEAQPAVITRDWLDDPARGELRLVWPIDADDPPPVRYPLSMRPSAPFRYAIEVHRAPEYVYPFSETIEAVPTLCACGEDLAFEWDEDDVVPPFGASTGIFAECDKCSRTFDPSKGSAVITNPFDESEEEVRGGAAYRFALKVDCGASFVEDPKLAFAPDLVALVEEEFGRSFFEVGSTY